MVPVRDKIAMTILVLSMVAMVPLLMTGVDNHVPGVVCGAIAGVCFLFLMLDLIWTS